MVAKQGGDTLWHNGRWSEGGFLHGVDEGGLDTYEPHFDVISQENDVQVYELVAVDVTGAPTNVLERAAGSAKDNRLLPLGFSLDHPVYDTTRVEGQALSDADFTENAGAGKDRVTYDMVADLPLGSNVDVDVRVWYQAMPPRWVNPMFDIQDSTIQAFKALFEAQGATPELVSELSLTIPVTSNVQETSLTAAGRLYPNPTTDGRVTVQVPAHLANGMWELYAPDGSRIAHGRAKRGCLWNCLRCAGRTCSRPTALASHGCSASCVAERQRWSLAKLASADRSPFSNVMWQ